MFKILERVDPECLQVSRTLKDEIKHCMDAYLEDNAESEPKLKAYYDGEFQENVFAVNAFHVEEFVSQIEDVLISHDKKRTGLYQDVKKFYVDAGIAAPFDHESWRRGEYSCTGGKRSAIWFRHNGVDYEFKEWLKK